MADNLVLENKCSLCCVCAGRFEDQLQKVVWGWWGGAAGDQFNFILYLII